MLVFISYGAKDALDKAWELANVLQKHGIEPWLDVGRGIPPGTSFDTRTEHAIEQCDALVALISPWSVRDESFCRKEIIYAQALKKRVIPVRLECIVPPFTVIDLGRIDAFPDTAAVFEKMPDAIEEVCSSGSLPEAYRQLPQKDAWWSLYRRLDFAEELARYGALFVGREWLFNDMREWLSLPATRLLLLTGDAGAGKSAIAAQMTSHLGVRGIHFCSSSNVDSCLPRAWLEALIYQLARQFEDYRAQIEEEGPPDWQKPVTSLFRTLIADPLRKCEHGDEQWVFVIDALDESVAQTGFELVDFLADSAERIPGWVRLVVTSRPDRDILARFKIDNVKYFHLDAQRKENVDDLRLYVSRRVELLEQSGSLPCGEDSAIEQVSMAASGNFLFAKMTLDALQDPDPTCRVDLQDLGSLPAKLGGLYLAMFRRRFKNIQEYRERILPILECLVAAREPVSLPHLTAAVGLDKYSFRGGLQALSQFLCCNSTGLRLFHQSLADWLTDDSAEYWVSKHAGQERMAKRGWAEYSMDSSALSPYSLSHLPAHLVQVNREEDLQRLLLDYIWIRTKIHATDPNAVISDYGLMSNNEDIRLVQSALRLSAHVLARDKYQLASQLYGRLVGCRSTLIQKMLAEVARRESSPWLRSLHPVLTPPGSLLRVFVGHTHIVSSVVVLPDGCRAVSASRDGTLKLWDLNTGKEVRTLKGHVNVVSSVAVLPDGCRAISASWDTTLRLWDIETGEEIKTLGGYRYRIFSVAAFPDGRRAISASEDSTLKLWDLESGKNIRTLEGHTDPVLSVAVLPDGRRAISASWDKTLRLWDIESGKTTRTFEGHTNIVLSVAVLPDGRRAISASGDKTLRLWDIESGKTIRTLEGHTDPVFSVAVPPDGRRAISASWDKTLRLWDIESGKTIRTLEGHTSPVFSVAVLPDGRRAVSASRCETLKLWDLDTSKQVRTLEGHICVFNCVAVLPDGRRAISLSGFGAETLKLRDLVTSKTIRTYEGHTIAVSSVVVLPDGRRAISASFDKTLKLWDIESGKNIRTLEGHTSPVFSVAVLPDGRRAISASGDKTLRLWDIESGKNIRTLEGHGVSSVAVLPDGRRAISASSDNTLQLWDIESAATILTFTGDCNFTCCAVSPDGKTIVAGDQFGRVHFLRLEIQD